MELPFEPQKDEFEKSGIAQHTSMVIQLQSARLIGAIELTNKYEVSTKMVYRDIKRMNQSEVLSGNYKE